MNSFSLSNHFRFCRRDHVTILYSLWITGLFVGILCANCMSQDFSALMLQALFSPVPIINLILSLILPFAFSVLAVSCQALWMLYICCFFKAAAFAYSCFVLWLSCSSGFLPSLIILFPSVLSMPFLWFFWLSKEESSKTAPGIFAALLCIMWVNRYFVLPFLARI